MLTLLKEDQIAFLLEHEDIFNALFEIADSEGFREVFGDLLLSDVIARYEAELIDTADESDPVLRERYERMKAEMETADHAEMLKKLRGPSLFDDLNAED